VGVTKPRPLEAHPAAAIFPMMSEDELAELATDIKDHGQRTPIVILDGLILDGRNRYAACGIAGVDPATVKYAGKVSPTDFVVGVNLRRRHLTPAQKAAVAVQLERLYAEEAKARQSDGLRKGAAPAKREAPVGGKSSPTGKSPGNRDESSRAAAQAAAATGAGIKSTQTLKAVEREAPAVFELAKEGKVTVAQAERLADETPRQQAKAVAEIRSGTPVADVLPFRPQPKASAGGFDVGSAAQRLREAIARERARWPERYHARFASLVRQIADALEGGE
jgi:ParB-like chromosome segregation protein Spo0J